MTPLHRLLDLEYSPEGLADLLSAGADPNARSGPFAETALHVAVRRRRLDCVDPLLEAGAEIDAKTAGGKTAWVHAYRRGFDEVAEALAAHGAIRDPNPADDLAAALARGDLPAANDLFDRQPTLADTGNPEEARILPDVTGYDRLEAVTLLLDRGAPIDARGLDGGTGLHQAAWFGAPRVTQLLIDRGAPLEIRCKEHDLTPLGWLCHGSRFSGGAEERAEVYVTIGKMLLAAGAERAAAADLIEGASESVRRIFSGWRIYPMRSRAFLLLGMLSMLGMATGVAFAAEIPVRKIETLSPVYTIDREYRSMTGPSSAQILEFPESSTPELLWVTGFKTSMVAADGVTEMPAEFMCHSNLDFDREHHAKLLGLPVYHTDRLFTLSQGQLEIRLPDGFGLPYYSDETFHLQTQVLQLNPDNESHDVRHKVSLEYVLDRTLERSVA